jgi:hypothetical protein
LWNDLYAATFLCITAAAAAAAAAGPAGADAATNTFYAITLQSNALHCTTLPLTTSRGRYYALLLLLLLAQLLA